MAWTYSKDPSESTKDAVRFLVGDTDDADQLLQDEEIAWLLSRTSDVTEAAAQAAETIAAKFARLADKTVGDFSIRLSQKSEAYQERAAAVRASVNSTSGALAVAPFAGGISTSDKQTREADTDRVEPVFTREMMDNHQGVSGAG